jgi:2-keto-3-deoxy-L-rhamnonate aldolase RhmA
LRSVVDESVPDAGISADVISRLRSAPYAVDEERHVAAEHLPPLGLRRVGVLGNVTARVGPDLGEQIVAVAAEAIALSTDRVEYLFIVTHE